MSGPESSPFPYALALLAAPFLGLALRHASRVLPARTRSVHRWSLREVLLVLATPFLVLVLASALDPHPHFLVVLLLNELALGSAAVLAIVLAARRPEGLASLGLVSAFPPHAWLLIPLAYVPLFLVDVGLGAGWSIVCRARGWEAEQEIMRLLLELRGNKLVVAGAVAVLLGPLVEELLFRGFLQSALAQVLGDRGAILVGSGIFAGLHGVAGLPILFTLSLFLGWLQARTRSIWVPWSAHALHNGVALCLALAMSPG